MLKIDRIIWPDDPNKEATLSDPERAALRMDGTTIVDGEFQLSLQLLPVPHTQFAGRFPNVAVDIQEVMRAVVEKSRDILFGTDEIPVRLTGILIETSDVILKVSPKPDRVYIGDRPPVDEVHAMLLNFPNVWSGAIQYSKQSGLVGQQVAVLQSDELILTLSPVVPRIGDLLTALNYEGGYAVTHFLSIKRVDGAQIQFNDFVSTIEALNYFFSFVRGNICLPALSHGVTSGEMSWADIGMPETERWSWEQNWFLARAEQLVPLFPSFMKKFKSPWKEALRSSIETYAQANHTRPSIKASIFLAQATLESLAWNVLVERRPVMRLRAFKRLNAADQIGILLHELRIDGQIPSGLPALQTFASHSKLSGPEALVEVRNHLIHADSGMKAITPHVLTDTWRLAMHYVELSLLSILEYNYRYHNRCKPPAPIFDFGESVPWAT